MKANGSNGAEVLRKSIQHFIIIIIIIIIIRARRVGRRRRHGCSRAGDRARWRAARRPAREGAGG